jgi:hypothetical protein
MIGVAAVDWTGSYGCGLILLDCGRRDLCWITVVDLVFLIMAVGICAGLRL